MFGAPFSHAESHSVKQHHFMADKDVIVGTTANQPIRLSFG